MSIKARETSLTREEYNAILSGQYPTTYKVVAHRYNLDFDTHGESSASATGGADFTVLKLDANTVLKIADTTMEKLDVPTNTWTPVASFSAPPSPLETRMAMTYDGTKIRVYCPTMGGLKVTESTDSGATWSSWTDFYNPAGSTSNFTYSSNLLLSVVNAAATTSALVYDGNLSTYWEAPTTLPTFNIGFSSAQYVTAYAITAPTDAALLPRMPRSWTFTGPTSLKQIVITEPWKTGERRVFYLASPAMGTTTTESGSLWRLADISSFSGEPPIIPELEVFRTEATSAPVIVHVAAPTPERVHVVFKDNTKQIYNLQVLIHANSTWTTSVSPVYWPFDLEDFCAVEISEGKDMLVATSHVAGATTVVRKDDESVREFLVSGGIIGFIYQNGDWSEHVDIDVVDSMSDFRWRESVHLTNINGRLYLTCYAGDGTDNFPFAYYRCYKSDDGQLWSLGDFLPLPDEVDGNGAALVLTGDDLYAFEKKKVFKSAATLYIDHENPVLQQDITQYIHGYSLSHSRALQASIELSNADNSFNNHPVLNENNVILLYHYSGIYWEGSQVLILIAITEVDKLDFEAAYAGGNLLTGGKVKISSRDKFAWLSDKAASEQAQYRKSQLQGGDNYQDYTDTAYGGLTHSVQQKGSWRTRDSWLINDSANAEAIVFSSFDTAIMNGGIITGFALAAHNANTYAGVCLRAYDTKNMLYAVYKGATQKIHLYERRNGVDTELASASVAGWTTIGVVRYIYVDMRYATIKIYISSDTSATQRNGGRTWQLLLTHNLNMSRYLYDGTYTRSISTMPLLRGYVGVISYSTIAGSKFWQTSVFDHKEPNNLERTVRWYSALAGLLPPYVDTLYEPNVLNWQLDNGMTIGVISSNVLIWDDPQMAWDDSDIVWG